MIEYKKVQRNKCQDCGNTIWFDKGRMGWVCTNCYKTHAKNSSEESSFVDDVIEVASTVSVISDIFGSSDSSSSSSDSSDWSGGGGDSSGGGASGDF